MSWLLALGLFLATASAEDEFAAFNDTARLATLLAGAKQNGRVYGAISAYDRFVGRSPYGDTFVFAGEASSVINVMTVPGCVDSKCTEYATKQYDLVASNTAIQFCTEGDTRFCGFGAFAVTGVFGSDERLLKHFMFHVVTRLQSSIGIYSLLGKEQHSGDASGFIPSGLIGASTRIGGVVTARGGFVNGVDETGLYGNATIEPARLFGTVALTEDFANLNTFLGGLDRLPLPGAVGMPSLFARKLQFGSPGRINALGQASADPKARFDFWTLHAQQESIGNRIDIFYAQEVHPFSKPHMMAIAYHTPNYHARPGDEEVDFGTTNWSIAAGAVELPTIASMGVRGGLKPYVDAEVQLRGGNTDKGGHGSLRLRLNEPEFLTMFPFAQNSMMIYYSFQLGSATSPFGG